MVAAYQKLLIDKCDCVAIALTRQVVLEHVVCRQWLLYV